MKTKPNSEHKLSSLAKFTPWVITICGGVGAFASLMLAIEEFHHLKNPEAVLNCDINPIIGCGSIMDTWQGHAILNVPNQLWGLAMFASLLTIGISLLIGAKYPRWFWRALLGGLVFGIIFVHWFIYQSLYVLRHLCPYCMTTWAALIPAFVIIAAYSLHADHVRSPKILAPFSQMLKSYWPEVALGWLVAILMLILWRFKDFFFGI